MSLSMEVVIRESLPSDKVTVMKMVNEAYDDCEKQFWVENHMRLTEPRFHRHVNKKELFIAEGNFSKIVGCVVISNTDDNGKNLSMLVVEPEFRRLGIGKKLVNFVIETAKEAKCDYVGVQILFPTYLPAPGKDLTKKWYLNLGFEFVGNMNFAEYFEEDSKYLVIDATFSVYKKILIDSINS